MGSNSPAHRHRWWDVLSDSDKESARRQALIGVAILPQRRLDHAYQLLEKTLRNVAQGTADEKHTVTDAEHDHSQ